MINIIKSLRKKDYLFIFFILLLVILQVYLELKMPDYTKAITAAVASGDADMDVILKNGGMMLLCAFGTLASAVVTGFFCSQLAANLAKSLRIRLFDKVSSFSNSEMGEFSTPSLITRTTNDVVQIQMFMAMGLQMLLKSPIMAIYAIIKISSTRLEWTLAAGLALLVIVIMVILLVIICLPKFRVIQKLTDNLNDATRENITGVRVIRAFNAWDYHKKRFDKVNDDITKNNLFQARGMGFMNPVMMITLNCLTVIIYLIGAYLINDIPMTGVSSMKERVDLFATMGVFTQYAMQVIMSFMMLVMIFIILPRTIVSAKRINEVLKTTPKIIDGDGVDTTKSGEIEFKDVAFSYRMGKRYVIENINLKINKGENVAFIGATGSGKSTIVKLLNRFYDTSSGEILVDGANVKEYKLSNLREKISFVSQKAVLFKGTIKDNIAYGEEGVDTDRLHRAIKIAHADFIYDLEDKENSFVAQGGSNFSGGQKQRISIARAIYKDSEILVFDDSFSALDYKTDMLVRRSIKEECDNKTIIIIAQRIGTIKNADKIVVLDHGRIVGVGTHEELINNNEVYKEIALSQLSKEEL